MKVSGSYGAHQGSSSPGGNMNLHNQASYTASSKKQLLLSWVNSIEYPNCLLASEISEFRDGVIFCEIVNEIILMNTKPDFLTQVKMNNITYQDSLRNLEMALAEIRSIRNKRPSQKIADLKSQDLTNNDEKILDLLEYLYAIAHGSPILQPQEPRINQNAPTSNPKFQTSNQRISDSQHVPSNIQYSPTSSYVQQSDPLRNMAPVHQNHLRNAASVPLPNRTAKLEQSLPMKNENISISNSEYSHYSPKSNQAENQRNSFSQVNPSQEPPKYYHYLGGKQQNYEEQNNQIPQQQVSFNQHYYSQNNPNEPGNYTANQFDNSIPENRAPVPQNLYTNPEKVEMDGPRSTRKTDKTLPAQSSSQIYQTPTAAGQKKGSQIRNASAGFNLDSQQTPITDHSYSLSPHAAGAPGEGRHSLQNRFSAKLTSHSQTPQKPVLTEESKHSANFLQQRIEELKETKRQSLNQKQTGSRDLTPVKKIENTSGLKSSIMETKLFLESQKPSDKTMVTPVIEQTKTKVIHWLVSITLLKENIRNIEKTLPKICKNGLLFIDLINRLEGKHETIKSAYRNPGTKTQIASNYKQVLNFLGRFEKMNPRYLLATQELAEGDEDVFWGLLDDMWHLYNKKISPYDSRYAKDDQYQTLSTNPFRGFERTISYSDIIYADRSRMDTSHAHVTSPLRTRSKSPSEYGTQEKVQKSGIEYNSNEPLHEVSDIADRESRFESNRTGQATNEGYQSGHSLKNSIRSDHEAPRKSIIKKGEASKFFSQSFHDENVMTNVDTSPHNGEHASHTQGESEVLDWLKHMGFKSMLMRKKTSLIDDPFRNGTLLCYIVGRVENERMHSLYKDPKTVDECRHNVYYCFQVLARRQTPIPVSLKGKEEEVLKGDESITLALLYSLMKISQNKADLNTSVLNNTFKSIKQEASVYIPPYDDSQKTRLEESLVRWVYSLGLFRETPTQPKTFKELTILMRTGVLLCDITALVTNQKITLIQRRPTNELQCIANIRKALEILRQNKTMGQKYLWKEKEIYLGNSSIILGILEDLRRLFDGLPPRNQANYFATGPYIPAEPKITLEEREVSDKLQYIPDRSRLLTSATFSPQAASSRRRQSTEDVRSPNGRRLEKSPSQNYREQASKLNLSSDEPISIVDYERANLKNSYNSTTPTNANVEIYMNTNESRWLGSNQGSLYTSPKAAAGRRLTSEDIFRGEKNNDQNLYKSTSPKGFYLDDKRSMYASSGFQQSQKSSMVSPRGSDLKEWIITLGFGPQTKDVDFDAPFIEDLKDGVLLCKVIEALELKELPGVILKPRTNASRILNIRKCFKILEKRQNVNPFSLNLEDEIVAGDGPAIRKIFNIIRESYKFMDNCVQKTQSPNASRFLETMRSGRSVTSTKSDKLSKSTERWALYRPHENYILSPKEREKSIIKPKYSKS